MKTLKNRIRDACPMDGSPQKTSKSHTKAIEFNKTIESNVNIQMRMELCTIHIPFSMQNTFLWRKIKHIWKLKRPKPGIPWGRARKNLCFRESRLALIFQRFWPHEASRKSRFGHHFNPKILLNRIKNRIISCGAFLSTPEAPRSAHDSDQTEKEGKS